MSKKEAKTLKDLAKITGFTESTISRVLNDLGSKYRISENTQIIIKKAAEKTNFSFNENARSLRLKKTFTIGLVIPDISNPWFAKIASKIEKETRNNGYNIFLCNSDGDVDIEKKSLELLQNWKVDGIIIVPIGLEYKHLLNIAKRGTPIVLVDRFFKGINLPYVSTNDFDGSYKATEYLIENGHQRIACVQGIIGTSSNNERVGGYKKALEIAGIKVNNKFISGTDFGFKNGYKEAKKIIKNLKSTKITALFSTGNQITLGILKAFKEEGISVPQDISIVSYDEQNYSELLYTSLSTISHLEDNELGVLALNLLFDRIDKRTSKNAKNILLPTQLIKRESVKNILKV